MSRHDEPIRQSLLRVDPLLSRYDPLERILLADDFDDGFHAWQTYFPDYDGYEDYPERYEHVEPLGDILAKSRTDPTMRVDRRIPNGPAGVPMLSSLTSWDVGTYGAFNGNYALKIPTIARAGDKGVAIRRLGSPWMSKYRVETWFTYGAEPCDFRWNERAIRSIMVTHDVMDLHNVRQQGREPVRWWPSVRFHYSEGNELVQRWQANFTGSKGVKDGPWTYLEDGAQELAFNRSPTKFQWHYLRFTFDLRTHEYVDFHCHGHEFDVAGRRYEPDPPLPGWRASTDKCPGLINTSFVIEANRDVRCFLYLDSVVISASDS